MFDHAACVGLQSRHGASDMAVNLDDLLDGAGFEQRRGNTLLDSQNDTF